MSLSSCLRTNPSRLNTRGLWKSITDIGGLSTNGDQIPILTSKTSTFRRKIEESSKEFIENERQTQATVKSVTTSTSHFTKMSPSFLRNSSLSPPSTKMLAKISGSIKNVESLIFDLKTTTRKRRTALQKATSALNIALRTVKQRGRHCLNVNIFDSLISYRKSS
jgi:hypothetical protein